MFVYGPFIPYSPYPEDNPDIESEVRMLNKPPVETFETEYGDIFYCVDIYKQPALDLPSLQNHTIQVEANVGAPQVNYRESISKVSEVQYIHRKQSGGQGQFADITVRFEPLEPDSGYAFKSEIKGGAVPKEYIPGVMKGLEECMSNGVLAGYPVVDVRAVLVDGSYHDVDSSVLAFQLATRGAFRNGMRKAGPKLLEPIMKVEVVTPEEHLGDVIGDLNSRRGQINSFGDTPGGLKLMYNTKADLLFQYVSTLRGMAKGRASYTMQLAQFDVVPQHIQKQLSASKEKAVTA